MLERLSLLIGEENIKKLKSKTVLVLGLGGVGSYAVEALARSGIGHLILVDQDVVDITNLNRQIIATKKTLGKPKTEVFEKRIEEISDTKVTTFQLRVTEANIDSIFKEKIDFAIDACDTVTTKFAFLKTCIRLHIPFVTCLGTGKRLSSNYLMLTELSKTENDPLARILRKKVRDENMIAKIPVVYSQELPKKIEGKTIGSAIFVPASAGLLAANYAFQTLLEGE